MDTVWKEMTEKREKREKKMMEEFWEEMTMEKREKREKKMREKWRKKAMKKQEKKAMVEKKGKEKISIEDTGKFGGFISEEPLKEKKAMEKRVIEKSEEPYVEYEWMRRHPPLDEKQREEVEKFLRRCREEESSDDDIHSGNLHLHEARWERQERYKEVIRKSDGFNLPKGPVPSDLDIDEPFISVYSPSQDPSSQYVLYAKLGIHRYNMLQGKNLQFSSMVKHNYIPERFSKFITCVAKDPDCCSFQHFQSGVSEDYDTKQMMVSCFIARPESAAEEVPVEPMLPAEPDDYYSALPQWPSSENDFKDKSRYYLLKRSELLNYDWIRLYLEIAFTQANSYFGARDLTKLVITTVAVQTGEGQEPPKERFKTGNATFYIKYKYYPKKCRFSRDRIAIIRRTINKKTGLSLMFHNYFEDTLL